MLVMNTQALPSMVLTYFLFEKKAYVLYFILPNLIPTGSARPSPIPFMRIGPALWFSYFDCKNSVNILQDDINS